MGHRNARPPGDPNANRGGAAGARRAREPREVKTQPWLRAHLRLCRRDCRDAFVRQSRISGTLVVKSDDPAAISLLSLEQAGDKSGEFTVDGAEQDHVIEGAEKLLSAFYLSRDMAQKMSAALRAQQKRGDYRDITNSDVLTTRLTDDMRAVSHDKHAGPGEPRSGFSESEESAAATRVTVMGRGRVKTEIRTTVTGADD